MAGTRCTVCDHPARKAIEVAMATSSERSISKQWSISDSAVHRHKTKHLQPAAARAMARREDLGAEQLIGKLVGLADVLDEALQTARKSGDLVALARVSKEFRETIVRLGQTAGVWADKPAINIDARRQTIQVLGKLTEDELRNLARLGAGVSDVAS